MHYQHQQKESALVRLISLAPLLVVVACAIGLVLHYILPVLDQLQAIGQ